VVLKDVLILMGGFSLYSNGERIDENQVRLLFSVEGFGVARAFVLGEARLRVSKKIWVDRATTPV
jgi:hypothetical protein